MRELERPSDISPVRPQALRATPAAASTLAVVGRGRMGRALSRALGQRGIAVSEPLAREPSVSRFDAVLLCVPDAQIATAAAAIERGPLVGHCSGATTLDALAPHEAFSLHPLMTVTAADGAQRFAGAGAAVAGSSPRALGYARQLADALNMTPFEVSDADRAAYHAAASIASNFLITLQAVAERLAANTGAGHEVLVPLVRAAVENWAELGAERALTGPVARGDETTVAAHRTVIAERQPELLSLYDELVAATRAVAAQPQTVAR
jgi:predicted short-subunit dehydrogenase-like oxidoreductase (DUF2520 family)